MPRLPVTLVVVVREQFRVTRQALASVLANTPGAPPIVYVDAGSPPWVAAYLRLQARRHRFHLIRSHRYLCPTESRMLAMPFVDTEYVLFIDNDVVVTPGWLDTLLGCAEETGAWAVGPLYCNDDPALGRIHMAGGLAHFREAGGRRSFFEKHRFPTLLVSDVRAALRREPTELVEYHCVLMRTEAVDRVNLLDPCYLSAGEGIHASLRLRHAGHLVYLEPSALVSNLQPPPFAWSDLPYYLLRWSDVWNRLSLEHFRRTWDLPIDDAWLRQHYGWLTQHRELAREWAIPRLRKVAGWRRGERSARLLVSALERRVTARYLRGRPDLRGLDERAPAPLALAAE